VNVNGGAIAIGLRLWEWGAVGRDLLQAPRRGGRRPRHALRRRGPRTSSAIRTLSPARRYVELGLRLGKHDDDLVDSYYGPDEWARRVDAEEPHDPASLAEEAHELLAELEDDPWLAAQVRALWTNARKLSGERFEYAEEGELVYGIEPRWHDEEPFRRAAAMLEERFPAQASPGRVSQWPTRSPSPRTSSSRRC
jgi:hypothetical protein